MYVYDNPPKAYRGRKERERVGKKHCWQASGTCQQYRPQRLLNRIGILSFSELCRNLYRYATTIPLDGT
jgi:hypothetical protein